MNSPIRQRGKQSAGFFRTVLAVSVPVSLQTLIANSLGMIDQIMIGQLGETSVVSISLGGRPGFILSFALGGICAACSIFVSQAEGADDRSRHPAVMKATLAGCLACAVPFFILAAFFPQTVLRFFTADSRVIRDGADYLRIVSVNYFALVVTLSASAVLRSTGHAKVPLLAGFVSVAANTLLNAVLIFGLLGFPELRERGAAYATVVSSFLGAAVLVVFMAVSRHPASPEKALRAGLSAAFCKEFCLMALPAVGNELLWAVGDAAYSAVYGRMGTAAIAAMTLTFPVQGLSVGLFSGLSVSAAVIIGGKLGANQFDDAYRSSWKFLKYSVVGCVGMAALLCALSGVYVSCYNVGAAVRLAGRQLLFVFSAYLPVKVCNMVAGSGIIRSGGETKYTLFLDVLGTYGIGLPLAFVCAFVLRLPVQAVYAVLSAEEVVRLVLGLRRVRGRKWMRRIVGGSEASARSAEAARAESAGQAETASRSDSE